MQKVLLAHDIWNCSYGLYFTLGATARFFWQNPLSWNFYHGRMHLPDVPLAGRAEKEKTASCGFRGLGKGGPRELVAGFLYLMLWGWFGRV